MNLKKNLIFNILYQAISTIVPLITLPYVSRVLGAGKIGDYSYALAITNYFCVIGMLGSSVYGQLEVSKKRDDRHELAKVFSTVFYSRVITITFSMILYIFYIYISKVDSRLFVVLLIYFVSQIIDIAWLFQGLEKFDITVSCSAITKLLSTIFIFILVKNQNDLLLYVGLLKGSILLGNLLMWINVKKHVYLCRVEIKEIICSIKSNLAFFIPTIAAIMFGSFDKCMIDWITHSNLENGYYEQASRIYNALVMLITALTTVMLPRMAYLWKDNNNKEIIKSYISKTIRYIALLSYPIATGLFVIASEFVPIYFGEGYDKCITLIRVFAFTIIVTCLNNIISNECLVANGKQNIMNRFLIISTIVNSILNIFFIYLWDSIGAALASLVSEGLMLLMVVIYSRDLLANRNLLKINIRYLLYSLMMSIFVFPIKLLQITLFYKLVLEILTGMFTFGLILVIVKDGLVIDAYKIIFSKIKKKNNLI